MPQKETPATNVLLHVSCLGLHALCALFNDHDGRYMKKAGVLDKTHRIISAKEKSELVYACFWT